MTVLAKVVQNIAFLMNTPTSYLIIHSEDMVPGQGKKIDREICFQWIIIQCINQTDIVHFCCCFCCCCYFQVYTICLASCLHRSHCCLPKFKRYRLTTNIYQNRHASFLHDRPWILPWIKSISNELGIAIHMIASQLSGHCHVIGNQLWRHQQNENCVSEIRERCIEIVISSSFMDSLCHVRNKIMYVLSWRTVSALTRGLFLCLFPSLLRNSGNKHKNNPLVSAETFRHSSTYIILSVSSECGMLLYTYTSVSYVSGGFTNNLYNPLVTSWRNNTLRNSMVGLLRYLANCNHTDEQSRAL